MAGNQQSLIASGGAESPTAALVCVGDPYYGFGFARTILSLHGEAFVDSSLNAQTVSIFRGSPTIDSTSSRFGTRSIRFPATPQSALKLPFASLYSLNQPIVADAAFTIEFWVQLIANPIGGTADIVCLGAPGAGPSNEPVRGGWAVGITSGRRIVFRAGNSETSGFNSVTSSSIDGIPLGEWVNIAICYTAALFDTSAPQIFINGVPEPGVQLNANDWRNIDYSESNAEGLLFGMLDNFYSGDPIVTLNARIDDFRLTKGISRYDVNTGFTPPDVTFCDAIDSEFSQEVVNGSAALTGVQATTGTGIMLTPARTVALMGVQATTAVGRLLSPPYPNLVSSSVETSSFLYPGDSVPVATAVFSVDGTYSVAYVNGAVVTGEWIRRSGSAYSIPSIASQYSIRYVATAYPSLVTPSAPFPAPLGTSIYFFAIPGITSFTVGVYIVPRSNNPRYGELRYVSETSISIVIEGTGG